MKRAWLAIPLVVLLAGYGSVTGTAASAVTRSTQLTGTQLAAALVPGSAFPRGYRYDSSTSSNSGNRLENGRVKYSLASISCTEFSNTFGQTGFGETATAGNSYGTLVDNYTARSGSAYDQNVYQFASTSTARSFWHGLRSVLARCPGFGLASFLGSSGSATQRFSAVQVPGAKAFSLEVTATGKFFGVSLLMHVNVWIAVAGQDVFEVDALGINRQAPAHPALGAVMRELISRVLAA
jgi:hypothetical protein